MDQKSTRKQSINDRFTKEKNIFLHSFCLDITVCITFETDSSASSAAPQIHCVVGCWDGIPWREF